MEKKNYTTLWISPSLGYKGSIYRRKGQPRECMEPSNLGARLHNIAMETRHLPCFRCKTWEARTAPPAARFPDVPLSDVLAGFLIWALGFDKTTLQNQWLSL